MADNLRSKVAEVKFSDEDADVEAYPRGEVKMYVLPIAVRCWHLDGQISSMAQICKAYNQIFSTAEHLALEHGA